MSYIQPVGQAGIMERGSHLHYTLFTSIGDPGSPATQGHMPLTTKITFTIELPAGLPAAPLILERTRRAPRPTWPLVLVLSSWSGAF